MQELMVFFVVCCFVSQLVICQFFNLMGVEGCFNGVVMIDWLWVKGIFNLGIIFRNVIFKDMKLNSFE